MIVAATERQSHCTSLTCRLKSAIALVLISAAAAPLAGQSDPGRPPLREELTRLIETGQTELAISRAQAALREAPDGPDVQHEYVALHLALARNWLSRKQFDECLTAVRAILAVQPNHEEAAAMQTEILAAREEAGKRQPEIDRLLRLELFEAALRSIREVKALRPDLGETLGDREQTAWRGAAEDHYFAGNWSEAFALHEQATSFPTELPGIAIDRRLRSLAMALSTSEGDVAITPQVRDRLSALLAGTPAENTPPLVRHAITGLLAERGGQWLDAGRAYAAALSVPWTLPSADRRDASLAELRGQVVDSLRALCESDRRRIRDGAWQFALADSWKQRQTEHFEVFARNDLVAKRVAEAAEFHFAGLSDWLGRNPEAAWEPACQIHVHAALNGLREATKSADVVRALTQTRTQGDRVLLRHVDLLQEDPWLLSSTLPHELTHVLLAEVNRSAQLPLAVDEGLALQAEPPARRLQLRRLLGAQTADLDALLSATRVPADQLPFFARCDALATMLLHKAGTISASDSASAAISVVLGAFQDGLVPQWWGALGWDSEQAFREDWATWNDARRDPPRMPLMIMASPSAPDRNRDASTPP